MQAVPSECSRKPLRINIPVHDPTLPMVYPYSLLIDAYVPTAISAQPPRNQRLFYRMAMQPAVGQQLHRTKLCSRFFNFGVCRDNCTFAHSSRDLRAAPDMLRTKLCRSWKLGECNRTSCRYAHGADQLRSTSGLYKTQKCIWFANGKCKHGDRCRHAHGDAEVRQSRVCEPPATGQLMYAI